MIQATVAIYPLGQADNAAIDIAITCLRESGLVAGVRSMHTELAGEASAIFRALERAYAAAGEHGGVVMTVSISNACPVVPAS